MTPWLVSRSLRHAPRRLLLEAVGVAFPVAMLAATLLYVDSAVESMTAVALEPIQVEMRGLATSPAVDVSRATRHVAAVSGVLHADRFAATDVVVSAKGTPGELSARLIAVDPAYLEHHPWAHAQQGSLRRGALLGQSLRASAGFGAARQVAIRLGGDAPPLSLTVPVAGTIDVRDAHTWFEIPYGEVQGDVAAVPRAVVVDYPTFERSVLPVLRSWSARGGLPPFDPGSTDLPPVSLETHIAVDHARYPSDPAAAVGWSAKLRRLLERRSEGQLLVADNAAEPLTEAQTDATNAKILFLLLGIPGVLVAAALGLAAASALAEAHRREDALLRLRGATAGQIARLVAARALVAGTIGAVLGLAVAVAAVSAAVGRPAWEGVPARHLVQSMLLALAAGALTTVVRLLRLRRAGRRSEVATDRRLLEPGWSPAWLRARLDLVAIGVGLAILAVNMLAGGLRSSPIQGPELALSFYVLLAPIALWIGCTLLVVRLLLAALARRARPERHRPLPSWSGASLRWLGRRPARTAVALLLGALAIGFGTEGLAFAATFQTAKAADNQAAIGSDLRVTPGNPASTLPDLGPGVVAVSPFRNVPARVGSDRKTILTVDASTYASTVTAAPQLLAGQGFEALARDPKGVLVAAEIADGFELSPGDTLPVSIFPDDVDNHRSLDLHVVGVYRSFPPTMPVTELAMTTAALPPAVVVPPDFYLARVGPGSAPGPVAAALRAGPLAEGYKVEQAGSSTARGLTTLNLAGLGRIESVGAVLIASVGVAVLGAFLVLERRREFAILRAVGAATANVLNGPALEGAIAAAGSLVVGVPVGLGLAMLAVRVLGLFFTLPPPLLSIPVGAIAGLVVLMVAASAVALGAALVAVDRVGAAAVLREQ